MHGELPRAQVRATGVAGRIVGLRGDLAAWLGRRGQWLLPRVVPLVLAGLGLLAILTFTSALARATLSGYPAISDGPTVIYLMRIRPPVDAPTLAVPSCGVPGLAAPKRPIDPGGRAPTPQAP